MDNSLLLPSLVLLVSFGLMLIVNTPIAVAIVLATFLTLVSLAGTVPLPVETLITHTMAAGMESFALLAIPLFILSGNLMGRGGMARRIMDFAAILLAPLPGGLALANVLACMLFGSISGSAAAAVSSIGGAMIPEMKNKNYPPEFGVALTATAATTGLLIPPSNVMIVYAMAAGGLSISSLFIAGILPGITMGLMLMAFAMVVAKIHGYGTSIDAPPAYSGLKLFKAFLVALPSLLLGVVVLGGIIWGIFTATEAAAISVVYAFIFSVLIYREVKFADCQTILLESGITAAVVLILIGASAAMAWMLSYLDLPQSLSQLLLTLSDNKWVLLVIVNFTLLGVGTFMDMTPAILIFTPILLPVMKSLNISPLHFGIFMIANLCVGLCTPPVGTCLFVGCTVGKTRLLPTTRAMLPFFVAMVLALALIVYFPALSTWLPKLAP